MKIYTNTFCQEKRPKKTKFGQLILENFFLRLKKQPNYSTMSISPTKTVDLESFEIIQKFDQGKTYRYYQISNIDTGKNYLAKIRPSCFENLSKEDLLNLSREINIISKIKHLSFPNFIGFSPNNFKNKPKAVLIIDYPKNWHLDKLIGNLTNTQKAIIIYCCRYVIFTLK